MRLFNWIEEYKKRPILTNEEMLTAVEKLEHGYWPWLIFALALHVFGLCAMFMGCFLSTRLLIVGGIVALDGSILMGTLKVVAHIRLQGIRIMLQSENRMAADLRRLDAAEL